MDTAFFSGSHPSLISSKMLKDINKELEFITPEGPTWNQSIGGFYKNYIRPNTFPIMVFVLLGLFLLIKYLIKKDKDNKNKKHKRKHKINSFEYDNDDDSDYNSVDRFIHNDNEYAVINGKKYEYNELTGKYRQVQDTSTEDDYSIEDKLREDSDDNWKIS
jgi:hypothetical protein